MSGVRQFDEQIILPMVLDVFWKNGWQATSLVEIAQVTGVQRGSLYNAYGGKDTLFLNAYKLYTNNFINSVKTAMTGDTLKEVLSGFFRAALENMTKGIPSRGCLTTKMLIEMDLTSEMIQQSIKDFMGELKAVMSERLSEGKLANSLKIPSDDAAEVILTFVRGIAVMERLHKDPQKLMTICDAFVCSLVE